MAFRDPVLAVISHLQHLCIAVLLPHDVSHQAVGQRVVSRGVCGDLQRIGGQIHHRIGQIIGIAELVKLLAQSADGILQSVHIIPAVSQDIHLLGQVEAFHKGPVEHADCHQCYDHNTDKCHGHSSFD